MNLRINLGDGKYTYILDRYGQRALRYGEPWRDLVGDKFIYSMAAKIEDLDFWTTNMKMFIQNLIFAEDVGEGTKEKAIKFLEKFNKDKLK